MELDSLLPCSQQSATNPHPEPDHNLVPYFFKISFCFVLTSMLGFLNDFLPSGFQTTTLYAFLVPIMHASYPFIDHPNNIK